jgi:hypothetical protein
MECYSAIDGKPVICDMNESREHMLCKIGKIHSNAPTSHLYVECKIVELTETE